MTKSELIERIAAKNPHLQAKDVARIVDVVLGNISETLAQGGRVEFRGFGSFSARKREARIAKNPRTGEKISIGGRVIPKFKAGRQLHNILNQK